MRTTLSFALTSLLLLVSGPARADGIDVQNFKPAFSRSGFFTLESPRVLGHLTPNVGLTFDYAKELLVARDPVTDEILPGGKLVDSRFSAHLTAALGLWERAEVGLRLPVVLYQDGSLEGIGGTGSPASTALGDLAIGGKVRLLGPSGWGSGFRLAATAALSVPTGSDEDFAGSGTVAFRPGLVAGLDLGPVAAALNVGYLARGEAKLPGLTLDDEIDAGLAAAVVAAPDLLWVMAEVWGRKGVSADTGASATPVEADAGLRLAIWGPWLAQAGVGVGLSEGYGTPKLRGILTVAYAPTGEKAVGASEPVAASPVADADGDRIPDATDRCPTQAEDFDNFEDTDGCPDPDNDGDGVPDATDKCPFEPEDRDGVEDADGCPEVDNDNDGIPDAKDACPDRAEDLDEYQDADGCPDPDNDGDGIPDIRDKCPLQPEVFNGNADDDGCPDAGPVLVELTKEKLVIKQEVKFQTNRAKVKPDSFQLLATVRKHLVEVNGVDADRLQAVGYGPDRPVAPNSTKQGRALNRRVEFMIVGP
jgi:outer membrane protein OmpA-like peptidoglycan-associated protein